MKTKKNCALQVAKKAFESLPVSLRGRMHVLGELVDCKGDVRACKTGVLKTTKSSIGYGIY